MKSILMACSASLIIQYFEAMLGSNRLVELGWDIKLAGALLSPWSTSLFFDPGHKKRKNLDKIQNPMLTQLNDIAYHQACVQALAQFRFNLKLTTRWILCFYLLVNRIKVIRNFNLATCRSTSTSKLQIFCWFWHSPFTACRQACTHPLTLTNLFRLRTKAIQIFHLKLVIITRQHLRNTITSITHRATIALYQGIWKIIKLPF